MKKVVSEISGIVFSIPWLMAKDYGLFADEGIDMHFVKAQGDRENRITFNPEEVDPILGHTPYEDKMVSIYRA